VSEAATVDPDARLRLFLALELPGEADSALRGWAREQLSVGGRVPDTFHATLAFLGWQPESRLERILELLRREARRAGPVELAPLRYRETRSVGMLVLSDSEGAAARLAARLHDGLEELDAYRRERRPWLPHVTVLRFRVRPRLRPVLLEIAPFAPSGVAAFLSRLHPSGARYEVLESCSLGTGERGG